MFLIFSENLMGVVQPITNNAINSNTVNKSSTKKELKVKKKLERKARKLEKKAQKIFDPEKKKNKSKAYLIIGVILLLIGILVLTGSTSGGLIAGCLEIFTRLIFGFGFGMGGLVLIIVGLIEGV